MFIIAIAGVMLSEDPYGYYNGYQDLLCSFVFVLFFLKKCAIPASFPSILSLQKELIVNKICRWVDSNHWSLVLETTAIPTEPQPLPHFSSCLIDISTVANISIWENRKNQNETLLPKFHWSFQLAWTFSRSSLLLWWASCPSPRSSWLQEQSAASRNSFTADWSTAKPVNY